MYSGKRFSTWDACETFINEWTKDQGFRIIKGQIHRDGEVELQQLIDLLQKFTEDVIMIN